MKNSVYLSHTDRDLTIADIIDKAYNIDVLRAQINLYALFFERLVLPDATTLLNSALKELLTNPDYQHAKYGSLVKDGTICFMQRSNAPTFPELAQSLVESSTWRKPEIQEILPFADHLESICGSRVPYDHDLLYRLYTNISDACLDNQHIQRYLGVENSLGEFRDYLAHKSVNNKGVYRRSHFYDYADIVRDRGNLDVAKHIREFASALYHGTHAEMASVPPAYPEHYMGSVTKLHRIGIERFVSLPRAEPSKSVVVFDEEVLFPMRSVMVLDYNHISDIRRSHQFKAYLKALDLQQKNMEKTEGFRESLLEYIAYLEEPLSLALSGRSSEVKSKRELSRLTEYSTLIGGAVITIAGGIVGSIALPAMGLGLAWAFGGWGISNWLTNNIKDSVAFSKKELLLARSQQRERVFPGGVILKP